MTLRLPFDIEIALGDRLATLSEPAGRELLHSPLGERVAAGEASGAPVEISFVTGARLTRASAAELPAVEVHGRD